MDKLLNKDDATPEKFYIFVRRNDPIAAQNFNITKGFSSAALGQCIGNPELLRKYMLGELNYLTFDKESKPDISMISPYHISALPSYKLEKEVELVRRDISPTYPSRLSAVFAFGDMETCENVAKLHNWHLDEVREFKLVDIPLTRVVKLNMEIISLLRHVNSAAPSEDSLRTQICKKYWEGEGDITIDIPGSGKKSSGENWEYLIEGRLNLYNPS